MTTELEIRNYLLSIPTWNNVSEDFISFCLTYGRVRRYGAKQFLYFADEEASTVFILLKGRIQLVLTNEFTEKILRVLSPTVFFPEVVFDGKRYPHAALALENSEVLALDRQAVKKFMENRPELIWNFFEMLALDLRRAYRQIKSLSLGNARMRLGAKLYALAHAHGKSEPTGTVITIPLSATELAGMCSLARESVSRILSELKELNIIEVDRKKITIYDPETLREWIHERPER